MNSIGERSSKEENGSKYRNFAVVDVSWLMVGRIGGVEVGLRK